MGTISTSILFIVQRHGLFYLLQLHQDFVPTNYLNTKNSTTQSGLDISQFSVSLTTNWSSTSSLCLTPAILRTQLNCILPISISVELEEKSNFFFFLNSSSSFRLIFPNLFAIFRHLPKIRLMFCKSIRHPSKQEEADQHCISITAPKLPAIMKNGRLCSFFFSTSGTCFPF